VHSKLFVYFVVVFFFLCARYPSKFAYIKKC